MKLRTLYLILLLSLVTVENAAQASLSLSNCKEAFAINLWPKPKPHLKALKDYLANNKSSHRVLGTYPKTTLRIGMLKREQQKFMVLALRAVREGSIDVIDAGPIVGPKVLSLVKTISEEAATSGKKLTIEGKVAPNSIRNTFESDVRSPPISGDEVQISARRYSEREVKNFHEAWEALELSKCLKAEGKIVFPKYPECSFRLTIENGKIELEYVRIQ